MKRLIASVLVSGLGAVAIAGIVSADNPGAPQTVVPIAAKYGFKGGPFPNTSPDIPALDAPGANTTTLAARYGFRGAGFPNTSPDLPEMVHSQHKVSGSALGIAARYGFKGGPFLNTSPDLPHLDDNDTALRPSRVQGAVNQDPIRSYVGTSPDLPELN